MKKEPDQVRATTAATFLIALKVTLCVAVLGPLTGHLWVSWAGAIGVFAMAIAWMVREGKG